MDGGAAAALACAASVRAFSYAPKAPSCGQPGEAGPAVLPELPPLGDSTAPPSFAEVAYFAVAKGFLPCPAETRDAAAVRTSAAPLLLLLALLMCGTERSVDTEPLLPAAAAASAAALGLGTAGLFGSEWKPITSPLGNWAYTGPTAGGEEGAAVEEGKAPAAPLLPATAGPKAETCVPGRRSPACRVDASSGSPPSSSCGPSTSTLSWACALPPG